MKNRTKSGIKGGSIYQLIYKTDKSTFSYNYTLPFEAYSLSSNLHEFVRYVKYLLPFLTNMRENPVKSGK